MQLTAVPFLPDTFDSPPKKPEELAQVCEVFFWRHAIPLFTVTYEPYTKGD